MGIPNSFRVLFSAGEGLDRTELILPFWASTSSPASSAVLTVQYFDIGTVSGAEGLTKSKFHLPSRWLSCSNLYAFDLECLELGSPKSQAKSLAAQPQGMTTKRSEICQPLKCFISSPTFVPLNCKVRSTTYPSLRHESWISKILTGAQPQVWGCSVALPPFPSAKTTSFQNKKM